MTAPGLPSWAAVSEERKAHIERVADLLRRWADALGIDSQEKHRWLRAAYLHDALRDADPTLLEELAPHAWGVPALRHGPAAAALAERDGEKDRGVLEAVRYHSVGYCKWDQVGRMLYLADYLDPGRRFREAERRALADRVPRDPEGVLRQVVAERLVWAIQAGRPLIEETVELWNALVGGESREP